MPNYAKDLRQCYNEGNISKKELISRVCNRAKEESKKRQGSKKLAIRGVRALFELQRTNPMKFFPIKEIYQKAGINPEQTPTSGLWVWDDEHGCGIIEKGERRREYRIRKEFLGVLQQVLKTTNSN